MSGNAVQRGELAIADKYARAEMALKCGADIVLELPYPWCAASAEGFASAAVRIISEYADKIFFGSECADVSALECAANVSMSEEFVEEYKNRLSGSNGSAETYFNLLEEKTEKKYLSNDILGIEYIKASKKMGIDISFGTVKRRANEYVSEKVKKFIEEGKK
jgi:predicted nucleotidyltransferase